jgi:hypothetical protein
MLSTTVFKKDGAKLTTFTHKALPNVLFVNLSECA